MQNIKEEINTSVEIDEEDLFYFESDHVALKGNKDYCELLKTIVILEAQKTQALQDMEKLLDLQTKALKDPLGFIKKLKNDEKLDVPYKQIIPEITYINWSKYSIPVPDEALKLINEGGSRYIPAPLPKRSKSHISSTHNQPWTAEEQKRLEELLIKYPPEAVEMRRFKKIADDLGNRSVTQVTSRVQKYFLKLYRAGLPVPGRIPKTIDKKKIHKHQRHNHLLFKPSTFFPETDVPVYMTEEDDDSALGHNIATFPENLNTSGSNMFTSNSELTQEEQVELKIEFLRKIKKEKEKSNKVPTAIHIGFSCDLCNEDPIKGCRWHCISCKDSVDFCTDCLITQLNCSNCHPLTHEFIALHSPKSVRNEESPIPSTSRIKEEIKSENEFSSDSDTYSDSNWNNTTGYNSEDSHMKDYDEDYISENFAQNSKKYNYLDPNFLPELYKSK